MKRAVFIALVCLLTVLTAFASPVLAKSGKSGAKTEQPAASTKAPEADGAAKAAPAPVVKDEGPSNAPPEEAPGKVIKEPASFNGVKWGTKLKDVPDMQVVGEHGETKYAVIPGTVYRIGDVFINEVVYAFCKDGFAAVRLEFTGRDKLDSIGRILADKYTAPVRLDGAGERYGLPLGNVLIMLDYDPKHDAGALGYSYRPIFDACSKNSK